MDPSHKPVRSFATPMMSALQVALVNAIDDPAVPYTELWKIVKEMANKTLAQGHVDMTAAVNAFDPHMEVLFNTIPRPVLRSITMRMVAYDFWERSSEARKKWLYEAEGPGAYIFALSVIGRKGASLTGYENRRLIQTLRTYAWAVEAVQEKGEVSGNCKLNKTDLMNLDVAAQIDDLYLKNPPHRDPGKIEMPRFGSPGTLPAARHIRQMITHLCRRSEPSWDGHQTCLQSPMMVGSSDDAEREKQNHRVVTEFTHTSKTWGLLISTLKYIRVEVEETFVPVLKAWEPEHINMGEILLTVVTGSLVSVDGFNVHQSGTKPVTLQPDDRSLQVNMEDVFNLPWYGENITASYESLPQVRRLRAAEKTLDELLSSGEIEAIVAETKEMEEKMCRARTRPRK
ncbi:hypothetical protein F5Y17DRAFT_387475 [Xylariaceae sp. FL0594]|nr:hypothetical protein F5Y17DRAFT_387475 [Xylariaceae sp. FL0594]